MGAKDTQMLKAFQEAAAYDGPSLILAYSPCIAHGLDLASGKGLEQQKLIVDSGLWPLYRYNPDLAAQGKNPLQLDSKTPKIPVSEFAYNESRYNMLLKTDEKRAEKLMSAAQADVNKRWELYEQMAAMNYENRADKKEE